MRIDRTTTERGMSYAYLIIPLRRTIRSFGQFDDSMIDEDAFDLPSVLDVLGEVYPGVTFSDEGEGNLFAHFAAEAGHPEIWIYSGKHCMAVSDTTERAVDIAKRLGMSAFDTDGSRACLYCP